MKRLQVSNRRRIVRALGIAPLLLSGSAGLFSTSQATSTPRVLRFGMTPVFLHDEYQLLERWRRYMEVKLGRQVKFVVRDSYRETMDLLRLKQLDFAWICDYPYIYLQPLLKLLLVPLFGGKPSYRSYLIINTNDHKSHKLLDLRGRIFAYADPFSNTGYLVPRYQLKQLGEDPKNFFRKTFFTWSHRKVIEAVASGLAQAGAVDSFVWETLHLQDPELTDRTRIIGRSEEFGAPPLVAHKDTVSIELFQQVQKMLLGMADDPLGRKLLTALGLDGFSIQQPQLYDSVIRMMRVLGEYPIP